MPGGFAMCFWGEDLLHGAVHAMGAVALSGSVVLQGHGASACAAAVNNADGGRVF